MILPWLTLALVTATTYERLTRGALLDVLGEDYIRTARAKGVDRAQGRLPPRAAVRPHAGGHPVRDRPWHLVGGAIVVENVFGLPGLGALAVNSVTNQDLPVDHRAGHAGVGLHRRGQHRGRPCLRLPGPTSPGAIARTFDQIKRKDHMSSQRHTARARASLGRAVPQWPFVSPDGRAGGFVRTASRRPGGGGPARGDDDGVLVGPLSGAPQWLDCGVPSVSTRVR